MERLRRYVTPRQGNHILEQVALCDGYPALQARLQQRFPDFQLILDFVHANEYPWKVANRLLGENNPERTAWVAEQSLQMLSVQTSDIIAAFRQWAQEEKRTQAQRELLLKTANYFQRNLPYMDYPLISPVAGPSLQESSKALAATGSKTVWNSPACAGPHQGRKACCICEPWLKVNYNRLSVGSLEGRMKFD